LKVGERPLFLNLLAFQQSTAVLCEGGDRARPVCADPARWRELLPYWASRLHAAWRVATEAGQGLASSDSERGPNSSPPAPSGLYGRAERARLVQRLAALEGLPSARDTGLFLEPQQAWRPAPVPTDVLRPAEAEAKVF
jgi:hypothetical protein